MLTGSSRKGEFIPDLLTVRSYALHQRELTEVLNHTARIASTGQVIGHAFALETLVAAASWVHEYTHFLQYVTRVQGVEYFAVRQLQASATATCTRSLARGAPSPSHRLNLPLCRFATRDAVVEDSAADAIHLWRRIWCKAQLHLAESGWEADQVHAGVLGRFLAEFRGQSLWPQVALGDVNSKTTTKDLTTGVLLEAEAWTNAFHFVRVFFPDDVVPVFNELVGWIDFENAGFGMALVHDRVDCLVPLVTDLCMQQPCFLTRGEPSAPRKCPAWLFDSAINECRQRFAGMGYTEVLRRREEIINHLCSALGCVDPSEAIESALATIEDHRATLWDGPMKRVLKRGLEVRREHPEWFTAPLIWLPELTRQVPGLRVLWNPPTTLPDGSHFISLWGDRFLSPEESGGLEVQRLQLWAAREIAMRSGGIICPMCMIGLGQSECNGDCFFARECRDSFGIDPVTGHPSTQPRDGGTQNEQ